MATATKPSPDGVQATNGELPGTNGASVDSAPNPAGSVDGAPVKRTRVAKPVEVLPEGLVSISALGGRKVDPYEKLRTLNGKRIVFFSVKTDADKNPTNADVYVYEGQLLEEPTAEQLFSIPVPKAAKKMLRRAVEKGVDGALSAVVETTKRGVALR